MDFIARDSLERAKQFQEELDDKVDDLVFFPYKFRQSRYFERDNFRDLIFKGYVVPYEIDKKKQTISVLGITKYREKF
ncbi:type II toxin-antitoxin system RelE/ParE family toxin [Sulfurovum sp. bin170]|nr:type II toxin-antitoxin system RelE/ParE family toxin [Sulfurovum sp. bin170]